MRKALTLIELIFTMIIIALVFMTVPKIIFVSNKSMQLQIKEDGLFDAVSLMGQVVHTAWDEKTIETGGKILANGEIACDGGKPDGTWIGVRSCTDVTPDDQPDGDCDDIDDFTLPQCHDDASGGRVDYRLDVSHTMDGAATFKELNVTVSSNHAKTGGSFATSFVYRSYNIGWAHTARRAVK